MIFKRIFWIITLFFVGTIAWAMISDMLESDRGTVMAFGVISIIGIIFGYIGYHKEIDHMLFGKNNERD